MSRVRVRAACVRSQTATALTLLKYDEAREEGGEEEEGAGDFAAGDGDGREPLDADLVHLRNSIRSNVSD